jgi:hypothetical protein
MTQQINLYAREPEQKLGPALLTGALMLATAALMLGYWQLLRSQNDRLDAQVRQATAHLATEQAALKAMKDILATRTDPARLAAELAGLKTSAAEAQEIVDRLRKGDLGTLDGFGNHFLAIANIGEPGLWVTGLRVHNAGRVVEVEGRSLQAQTVLRYATEVNKNVAPFGAAITALEMTPVVGRNDAPAVAFKLF